MGEWRIERLRRSHDRTSFDCGHAVLNEWLQHRAGQWDRKDLSRTWVVLPAGETRVVGYYAISSHRVAFEALSDDQSRGLPRIGVPVVLLGRLAVDRTFQGRGLGAELLIDALRRVLTIAEHVGVRAVEVDAIDEAAQRFYLKYGFVPLRDDPRHLFLPVHVIQQLDLVKTD